jgi:hypothetical protein
MDYEDWFQKNINECLTVYNTMSGKFRTWFYNYCESQGVSVKPNEILNEVIDDVMKYRLGICDSYSSLNSTTVSEILESLVYGAMPKSLKSIFKQYLKECKNNKNIDRSVIVSLNNSIYENANVKLEYL